MPDFKPEGVESVKVRLRDWGDQQKAAEIESSDSVLVGSLLAIFRSAQRTNDHKCGETGTITLRRKDGSETSLGILAGHDQQYYEFRAHHGTGYDIFRVERAPFLRAMRAMGAGELDPGSPE
jgi:hypothetical protein